jgi:hypothetical protein
MNTWTVVQVLHSCHFSGSDGGRPSHDRAKLEVQAVRFPNQL